MDAYWYINKIDIFEGIDPDEIKQVCTSVSDKTYDSRYVLYIPNDEISRMFFVKEGEILLYHMHDGRKTVFDTLGPGDVFGNFSKEAVRASHFAEVTPGTRVCTFSIEDFLKMVSRYPDVMLRTLRVLSERLKDYESKISICPAPAKEKVLHELERYMRKRSQSLLGKLTSKREARLTHQKIATLTGLNRVTVTRALHELESENKLHFSEHGGIVLGSKED